MKSPILSCSGSKSAVKNALIFVFIIMTTALSPKHRSLAWIAAIAFFMQALDATILNTALPAMSADFAQSPLDMQMAVISYALTVALFIPLSGWLADKQGTLVVFRYAVGLFVLGSLACAFSTTLTQLILARILQGLGGALMMPVARLAILRTIPKNQLLPVWNLMAMAGLIGPIVGPILGGWLVTYASWHWIFLINLPIGMLGIWLAADYMPNCMGEMRKLDWLGFLFFAAGLASITLGLDLITQAHIGIATALLIIFSGVLALLAYIRHAKKHQNPLIPLALFEIRTFRLGLAANLLVRLCGSGIPFLLPLMLQVVFAYPPDMAGWLIAPIAISSLLSKTFSGKLLVRYGYKTALIFTALLMTITIGFMSQLENNSPMWCYILLVSLYGGGLSMMFGAVNTLTVADLNEQTASAGATLLSVIQQVGIGIGIAVASLMLSSYRHIFPHTELQSAFSYTFLSLSGFGILLLLLLRRLKQTDGQNLH